MSAVAPRCPQCAQPMAALRLDGHYGQPVQTDLCAACDLIWFDQMESAHLSGLGWVQVLRHMRLAQQSPSGPQQEALDCPRCATRLKPVHNLSTLGRFGELECPRCRGGLAGFAQVLARRGLVRPLGRRDLDVLRAEGRPVCCLNCGAGLARTDGARGLLDSAAPCPYCASPLLVIDMTRFLSALLMRHAEAIAPERLRWPCHGCGAAVEPTHALACEQCGQATVVPSLIDLKPVLDAAEPLLLAARPRGAKAHGQRLRAMRGDVRETALYRYMLRLRHWLLGED